LGYQNLIGEVGRLLQFQTNWRLGIKDLRVFLKVLVAKGSWQLITENEMWQEILRYIFLQCK